jgi:replicative DNA helicase
MISELALPTSIESERFVLGSILLDEAFFPDSMVLGVEDFSLESHRRVWRVMKELYERGEHIDRITLYNELERCDQKMTLDFIISLGSDLPLIPNIDSYIRIVQEKSTLRKAVYAGQALISRCLLEGEPSAEILAQAQVAINALSDAQGSRAEWQSPREVIETYPGGMNAFLCPPRGGNGLSTPWVGLTEKLAGLHEGDLFVLAGRPGMGKSLTAMQIGHHVAAKEGKQVAVFSLEMTNASLVKRLVASMSRVDAQKLRTGYMNGDERRKVTAAANEIADLETLWFDDTRCRTIAAMSMALRKLASKGRTPRVIIVDHVQLMVGIGRKMDNRHREISDIAHGLKHIAGEMSATVMLLSQLNRECEKENRRPQLSDLKESGTLEEDADVVMFVHREECYARNRGRDDLKGLAEFIVAKQREGPTGKKNMIFLAGLQRFEEPAEDRMEEMD